MFADALICVTGQVDYLSTEFTRDIRAWYVYGWKGECIYEVS